MQEKWSSGFEERNKSVTCKDLKGVETGVVLRSCPDCVRDAAEFLADILAEEAWIKIIKITLIGDRYGILGYL